MFPYIGHEFVEILVRLRSAVETSSSDEALVQADPDIGSAPEDPQGRSRLTLWNLLVAAFEVATRRLL